MLANYQFILPPWRTWKKGWSVSSLEQKLCWFLASLEWKLRPSKVSCNPVIFGCCKSMIFWAALIIVPVSLRWLLISFKSPYVSQKQPSRGVFSKRCSENMQQIYRRTPMPKCDFNNVAKQLYWNHTSVLVFSCKFAAYFQNTFS